MVEAARGGGSSGEAAPVTRVVTRVPLRASRAQASRGVHCLGVAACHAPAPCHAHYGVCVPVVVNITDPDSVLGTVHPDKDAILKLVAHNRKATTDSKRRLVGVGGEEGETKKEEEGVEGKEKEQKEGGGTLAELAPGKRAGRAAPPGPDPPTAAHQTPLFSELMQTDDVSTIAAQIANQAELIYQTWKTTGLNPTDLIRYHRIGTEGGALDAGDQAAPRTAHPAPVPAKQQQQQQQPRTPVRNISPAPPGSSPAVPRKLIDPAFHNGRAHAPSPTRTLNTSPRPYVPPGSPSSSPGVQLQPQQPTFPTAAAASGSQQSAHQSQPAPLSPSPGPGGPRPYVTPSPTQSLRGPSNHPPPPPERSSSYPGVDQSPQSLPPEESQDLLGDPDLEASLQELVNSFVVEDKARQHAAVAALASQQPRSAPSSIQEALQRFERQMAITSRAAAHSFVSQPSTMPISSALTTVGRFAQQQLQQQQQQLQQHQHQQQQQQQLSNNVASSGAGMSSSSVTINTMGRRYGGTRSDSAVSSTDWLRSQMEHDARSRRSVSPSPPVSQPGWNETPASATSTWPLKNKQPAVVERKTNKQTMSSAHISSSSSTSSSFSTSTTSTNYITTLETRVESSGNQKFTGVPLRHKVVTMSAIDQEEERLMQALRTGTLIDDGDHLRPLGQPRPLSAPSPLSLTYSSSPSTPTTLTQSTHESSPQPHPRKPKYSISVTVDVDKPSETGQQRSPQPQPLQQQQTQQQHQLQQQRLQQQQQVHQKLHQQQQQLQQRVQQQQQQIQQHIQQHQLAMRQNAQSRLAALTGKETDMSAVDFAKVRYQESQQKPHSSQRLDDYRSISCKQIVNGDGRVMMARSRFENGSAALTDSMWRGGLGIQADEVSSTLPELFRRKQRKQRKAGSPEPMVAGSISSLPHPELTDQQKAHIRERSQSPTAGYNSAGVAIRPFLTQGSVAERVLIFERAPAEMKPKPGPPIAAAPTDKRRPALSTWRDPNEVRSLAQEGVQQSVTTPAAAPLRQIEPAPSTTTTSTPTTTPSSTTTTATNATATTTTTNNANLDAKALTYVRENSVAQKENARPLSASGATSPVSPLSPASSTTSSPLAALTPTTPASPTPSLTPNSTSPLGLGGHAASPRGVPSLRRHNKTTKNLLIPRFYYPMGRPTPQASQEAAVAQVAAVFREEGGQITRENMEPLMRACQLPLYWKAPLFIAAGGDKLGYLTQEQFTDYWSRVVATCHDEASRFVRILTRGVRNYLLPEDFLSMIQDVVDTHPGLTFLKEATEFHSRYVHTVIARIYYCVNRSWSGRITLPELRRSNLLQVINYLEEEEDINQITDYFSYEHFYVIYCKFWELDTDHDLFIDNHDLAKHNERALSWRMIERIFSGAVTRGRLQKQDRMGYQEFVWFLISEEDKRHPTAIEYWFRCMDLDGDGYLSMYELEYFYEEQLQRMEALGIETLPFHDCLCQMLDMVRPEAGDKISLRDLKKCRMTPIFFDTFFNLEKYLDHEQRDPFASHRAEDDGPEVSDWDRYAAEEYELLVAEEGGADHQDDMFYPEEDELSMGCEDALDGRGGSGGGGGGGGGGGLSKHSPLSATVTNLAADPMDVDDEYPDYADSDDYQY